MAIWRNISNSHLSPEWNLCANWQVSMPNFAKWTRRKEKSDVEEVEFVWQIPSISCDQGVLPTKPPKDRSRVRCLQHSEAVSVATRSNVGSWLVLDSWRLCAHLSQLFIMVIVEILFFLFQLIVKDAPIASWPETLLFLVFMSPMKKLGPKMSRLYREESLNWTTSDKTDVTSYMEKSMGNPVLVLTGFGPFSGHPVNASAEAVKHIRDNSMWQNQEVSW